MDSNIMKLTLIGELSDVLVQLGQICYGATVFGPCIVNCFREFDSRLRCDIMSEPKSQPSYTDRAGGIAWEVSDVLYSEAKATEFENHDKFNRNLATSADVHGFNAAVNEGTKLFLHVLKQKAEMDAAVVLIAGRQLGEFSEHITQRMEEEYKSHVETLREALI